MKRLDLQPSRVPTGASYLQHAMNRYRRYQRSVPRIPRYRLIALADVSLTFNRRFVRVNGTMIPPMMTISSELRTFAQPRSPYPYQCAYAYGA